MMRLNELIIQIQINNQMEQMLREENYQLKNEITDLKNAFDLNRDILKILSSYTARSDPEHHLLLQIITRLTTVNNQAMLNSIELIQEKNILKQENLRLNLELKAAEEKLGVQVEHNRLCNNPNESKMLMNEQFNSLNRELLAANEERIAKDQEIEYWKQKYTRALEKDEPSTLQSNPSSFQTTTKNPKIKRKYESNSSFKYQIMLREAEKEKKRLHRYIQQLENRLIVFIKAYNIKEESLKKRKNNRQDSFQAERAEIRLLKYALNSINVEKRNDQTILSITERFRDKDPMNNLYLKDRRNASWPKNHIPPRQDSQEDQDWDLRFHREMQERQY